MQKTRPHFSKYLYFLDITSEASISLPLVPWTKGTNFLHPYYRIMKILHCLRCAEGMYARVTGQGLSGTQTGDLRCKAVQPQLLIPIEEVLS